MDFVNWNYKTLEDMNKALEKAWEELKAAAPDRECDCRALQTSDFGMLLGDRFAKTGAAADIDEAIRFGRRALAETSGPEDRIKPDKPGILNKLAMLLVDKSNSIGGADELNEAIGLHKQACQIAQFFGSKGLPDPNWSMYSAKFALALWIRHKRTGEPTDLDDAITLGRYVAATAEKDHPNRAEWVVDFGIALVRRHSITKRKADLEEGCKAQREALASMEEDYDAKAGLLTRIGTALRSLYRETNAINYLEKAIKVNWDALMLTSRDGDDRADLLNDLGLCMADKYERTKLMADLREAVSMERKALALTPSNSPERPTRLDDLGSALRLQFFQTREMNDLGEAINAHRRAVAAEPTDGPEFATFLNNLADALSERQAVDATPESDSDRTCWLRDLGIALDVRYSTVGAMDDREGALAWHLSALHRPNSPVTQRILAGIPIVAISTDNQQVYEAAKAIVDLVPALISKSLSVDDQEWVLGPVVGLASDAAAAALQVGKPPMAALSLLEKGRSIITAIVDDTPTGLADLRRGYPRQAKRFLRLRGELQRCSNPGTPLEQHDVVRKKFDHLLSEIRTIPEFTDFLLPPGEAEMREAAQHGPIVVINVSRIRCDAFLIERRQVRVVELPGLSRAEIARRQRQTILSARVNLEWLWDTVASPVLNALGLTGPPSDGDWRRVWWIPTGVLSSFPIHAAGYHGDGSDNTVIDRVMSSYACSVKSIISIRRKPSRWSGTGVLVGMGDTPDYSPLPHAAQEVAELHTLFQDLSLRPVQPEPNRKAVMSQLKGCSVFHFAGHGFTDIAPSDSQLLLRDWKEDPLRVVDLAQPDTDGRYPFLAYLSASGVTRHESSHHETFQLISSCQLAGFRHVIGTLWKVNGRMRVDVARLVYENIRVGAVTDEAVCRALHAATRQHRTDWLEAELLEEGTPATTNDGGSSAGQQEASYIDECHDPQPLAGNGGQYWLERPPLWASFVHFGA
ncbi:unnamed protein product [Clonostachys solani]|uniref:CHAT domain-containing protein n=1 Tax=Clonostachys solani TaxID=160281 RepID=A0A9N9YZT6_9HYPO|nr:unnamed protein product [Clonostachys solani]